ncbi:MAG: tetratricopeptide repeat protein [Beijerinckiaceae bacterium]
MTLLTPRRAAADDAPAPTASADECRAVFHSVAAHLQAGRKQEAVDELKILLPSQVAEAAQCQLVGSILVGANALQEALGWFERAYRLSPEDPGSAANHATLLFRLGRLEEALLGYDAALRLCRTDAKVFYNRGLVLRALGRTNEAIGSLDEALKLDPGDPETLRAGGLILRDAGRLERAVAFFEEAIRLRPDFRECLIDRANLLQKLGRFEAAVAAYSEALVRFPNDADLLNNRGGALRELGELDAALESYEAALAVRPAFPQALFNRGTILLKKAPPDAALAAYEAALALRPNYCDAHVGRGVALKELCRFDEADEAFDVALAQEPDSAHAKNNKGALQLLRGDFAAGLDGYEFRWLATGVHKRTLNFPIPEWQYPGRAGERVLVYDEQGFGDTFQFSRYLPLMAEAGVAVTFFCRGALVHLMRGIDPRVRVVDHFGREAVFHAQIALSSLPRAFGTRLETIPAPSGYLAADPQRVAQWRNRLGAHGFKIGLCWQGNPNPCADLNRSIPFAAFAPLAALQGVRLISLQRPDVAAAAAAASLGVEVAPDLDAEGDAFADTAAVMQNVDLIVACDTSVAHLAGALGRPVFVLLKRVPDWRWLLDRTDSPWYPTMRLFRQKERGNWAQVVARVAAAVVNLLAQHESSPAESVSIRG